jgi:hypothetical protein
VETLELKNANKLLESELKLVKQESAVGDLRQFKLVHLFLFTAPSFLLLPAQIFLYRKLKTAKALLERELTTANKLWESEHAKQNLENKLAFQALAHEHQASHLALSNDLRQKEARQQQCLLRAQARISELETMLLKLREQEGAVAKKRQRKERECPSPRTHLPQERAQRRPTLSGLGFPHLLATVLEMVGGRTLLLDVPLVCKEWKATCREEVVPAVMEFTQLGMRAISDYGLVVMLQRFPAASKIDISGKKPVPDSPSFHLNQHNNCVNTACFSYRSYFRL